MFFGMYLTPDPTLNLNPNVSKCQTSRVCSKVVREFETSTASTTGGEIIESDKEVHLIIIEKKDIAKK